MAKTELKIDKKLINKLKKMKNIDDIKSVVKYHGGNLQRTAMKKASSSGVFVKGYSEGFTRRDLQYGLSIEDAGLTAVLKSRTDYAWYLEKGTRFMEAEPYMKPSLDEVKNDFIKDMNKIIKRKVKDD